MAIGLLNLRSGLYNYRAGGTDDPATQAQKFADAQARAVGFKSAADQEANRLMRNQLEMQAAAVGYANPYDLVIGDLTNTAALQEAWGKLSKLPIQQAAPAPTPPAPPPPPPLEPATNEYTARIADLENQLANKTTTPAQPQLPDFASLFSGLQNTFASQMAAQQQQSATQMASMQEALREQNAAMQAQYENQMKIMAANQRAYQINTERAAKTPNMQIQPTGTGKVGGTSAFRRRPGTNLMISSPVDMLTPMLNV